MEIITTTAVYHNKEMDPSSGNPAELQRSHYTLSLVIYSLVFVLGVPGNAVVIWATGFKMRKTVTTVWYLNLAVADFLVTATMPLAIAYAALGGHWPFGWFACKMTVSVLFLNMYASIYVLAVISVDRCVCVVRPVWAQNHRTVRMASWVSLGVWALGLALSSYNMVNRNATPSPRDKDVIQCFDDFRLPQNYTIPEVNRLRAYRFGLMYFTAQFLMGFAVPFTVIISCYSVIVYRLRNSRLPSSRSGRPYRIIATVIAMFLLCWAPYHVMHQVAFVKMLATEYSGPDGVDTLGIPVAIGLALLNSCVNPLLYVCMGQGFKDVFRRSVLKGLEKAFAEELPQTLKISTNPGSAMQSRDGLDDTQI